MHKHWGPNVWRPNRVLSVPQIDLSVRADRKMVNLYVYLRICTKKTRFYRTDMQIKNIKIVFLRVRRKKLCAPSYAYLRICVFLKKSQPYGRPCSCPPNPSTIGKLRLSAFCIGYQSRNIVNLNTLNLQVQHWLCQ